VLNGVTKKNLESLILADAFQTFSYNKKTLIHNLDELMNYAELTKDLDKSLVMIPELEEQEDDTLKEKLEQELTVFGFYFTYHPTTIYEKMYPTKKGEKMAFLTASDETESLSYTLFPKTYNLYETLSLKEIVKITGTVEKRLNEYQIIADKIERVDQNEKER